MLHDYLGEAGFNVTIVTNGVDAIDRCQSNTFDALVLDLMLPDMDGLDVCRQVRLRDTTPILMLTARGETADRVVGLELGADDYLSKPFEPRELLARLRAILRRVKTHGSADVMRFGRLDIDLGSCEVQLDGETCPLTSHQVALLTVLAKNAGRVMTRESIMDQLKGETLDAFDRSIDVHISRIRSAIEDDPKRPRRVITIRGVGYLFAKIQDQEDGP
jgi:DNA-binding response OmpR family regulator